MAMSAILLIQHINREDQLARQKRLNEQLRADYDTLQVCGFNVPIESAL
jgi:hypothetical protein